MILTTTSTVDGRQVTRYHGVVSSEVIIGANVFRDLFAGIRDIVGGRSASYERPLKDARKTALDELADEARAVGANGVIGIDIDYEVIGKNGSMLMVSATGTAVTVSGI
jgi:uncharacterized protein YbjQ (UPF0145 family)